MTSPQQNQQVSPPSPTSVRPGAELESRLAAALSGAFPIIPCAQLSEQRHCTVRLGHEAHDFDSAA